MIFLLCKKKVKHDLPMLEGAHRAPEKLVFSYFASSYSLLDILGKNGESCQREVRGSAEVERKVS